MAVLEPQDRNLIINLMASLTLFDTYRSRRCLLESAGLQMLISQIDLEGAPLVVAGDTVRTLETYGRVMPEYESLGMLLNTIKESIGDSDDKQKLIDSLLTKYSLMTPVSKSTSSVDWQSDPKEHEYLEKVIGENTLRQISFLAQGMEASRSVVFVDVKLWTGTGFLVGPDILMTNHHVVPDDAALRRAVFRFNYQLTATGANEKTVDYVAYSDGLLLTDEELDLSLIRLRDLPGTNWGQCTIKAQPPETGTRVNIIQHPAGLPKQISLQNNFVEYSDGKVIQYLTSTLGGSSGSPVFDDDWKVVALHHAGGMLMEPTTKRRYFRNEGISMNAIWDRIPTDVQKMIKKRE